MAGVLSVAMARGRGIDASLHAGTAPGGVPVNERVLTATPEDTSCGESDSSMAVGRLLLAR